MSVLELPTFSKEFKELLNVVGLTTIERFVAFGADSVEQFFEQLTDMAPALIPKTCKVPEVLQQILDCSDEFHMLWLILMAAKERLLFASAISLGFGMIGTTAPLSAALEAPMKRRVVAPLYAPTRINVVAREVPDSGQVLLQTEMAEKAKWLDRLEAIACRAGDAAGINRSARGSVLSEADAAKIRRLVLRRGAFRTMAVHIRHWGRFADWSVRNSLTVYPPSLDAIIKYMIHLDDLECGPSVIPSVRAALSWVAARIKTPFA